MMLGGNISERTNTLSLEIFNAVSRADFDAANALCLLLSLFAAVIFLAAEPSSGAAQGSDLKRPYDAGTLRLDSSEMADRLEWKDYPILFIYPP